MAPVASRLPWAQGHGLFQVIASAWKERRLARDFKPSQKSRSPEGETIAALRFLCKAAGAIETRIEHGGAVPLWVEREIREATMKIGMAVSYLRQHDENSKKGGQK